MSKSFFTALLCFSGLSLFATSGAAQESLRVTVANLKQDVSLLTQNLKSIRLEMESLQRENARLRAEVKAAGSKRDTEAQIKDLSRAVENLRREYRSADATQKKQILAEVNRQLSELAKETQGAINSVAEAVDSQPQIATPNVSFSQDFPQTGQSYVVRSGDTLSKIAREHGSTVKYIQNANKIVNPSRDLQVGETIFIPISK